MNQNIFKLSSKEFLNILDTKYIKTLKPIDDNILYLFDPNSILIEKCGLPRTVSIQNYTTTVNRLIDLTSIKKKYITYNDLFYKIPKEDFNLSNASQHIIQLFLIKLLTRDTVLEMRDNSLRVIDTIKSYNPRDDRMTEVNELIKKIDKYIRTIEPKPIAFFDTKSLQGEVLLSTNSIYSSINGIYEMYKNIKISDNCPIVFYNDNIRCFQSTLYNQRLIRSINEDIISGTESLFGLYKPFNMYKRSDNYRKYIFNQSRFSLNLSTVGFFNKFIFDVLEDSIGIDLEKDISQHSMYNLRLKLAVPISKVMKVNEFIRLVQDDIFLNNTISLNSIRHNVFLNKPYNFTFDVDIYNENRMLYKDISMEVLRSTEAFIGSSITTKINKRNKEVLNTEITQYNPRQVFLQFSNIKCSELEVPAILSYFSKFSSIYESNATIDVIDDEYPINQKYKNYSNHIFSYFYNTNLLDDLINHKDLPLYLSQRFNNKINKNVLHTTETEKIVKTRVLNVQPGTSNNNLQIYKERVFCLNGENSKGVDRIVEDKKYMTHFNTKRLKIVKCYEKLKNVKNKKDINSILNKRKYVATGRIHRLQINPLLTLFNVNYITVDSKQVNTLLTSIDTSYDTNTIIHSIEYLKSESIDYFEVDNNRINKIREEIAQYYIDRCDMFDITKIWNHMTPQQIYNYIKHSVNELDPRFFASIIESYYNCELHLLRYDENGNIIYLNRFLITNKGYVRNIDKDVYLIYVENVNKDNTSDTYSWANITPQCHPLIFEDTYNRKVYKDMKEFDNIDMWEVRRSNVRFIDEVNNRIVKPDELMLDDIEPKCIINKEVDNIYMNDTNNIIRLFQKYINVFEWLYYYVYYNKQNENIDKIFYEEYLHVVNSTDEVLKQLSSIPNIIPGIDRISNLTEVIKESKLYITKSMMKNNKIQSLLNIISTNKLSNDEVSTKLLKTTIFLNTLRDIDKVDDGSTVEMKYKEDLIEHINNIVCRFILKDLKTYANSLTIHFHVFDKDGNCYRIENWKRESNTEYTTFLHNIMRIKNMQDKSVVTFIIEGDYIITLDGTIFEPELHFGILQYDNTTRIFGNCIQVYSN